MNMKVDRCDRCESNSGQALVLASFDRVQRLSLCSDLLYCSDVMIYVLMKITAAGRRSSICNCCGASSVRLSVKMFRSSVLTCFIVG